MARWPARLGSGIVDAMADSDPSSSNAPEISVSELANALKRTLEDRFGFVRVRGEISGYRGPHSSGHVYFSLKDANARLDSVIWRGVFQRMRIKPEEGMEVVACGKISSFPGKSSYQLIVETLEPAGVGALMALLDQRRRALQAEGLFDAARKQKLPYLPRVVGIVTSPTGAVIRDILHRLADRFPVRVVLWPVRVQGETSAAEVAAAIRGFNALQPGDPVPRPDVLIVARGGGSLEDLWSFNEEIVVRAAAESAIPLISAVGHETDTTLIDHAADLRAPTPSAAAELAVPVRAELLARLANLDGRAQGAMLRLAQRRRNDLRALSRALPSGQDLVGGARQKLDFAAAALRAKARAALDARGLRIERLSRRLSHQSPRARTAAAGERHKALAARLERIAARLVERNQEKLQRVIGANRAGRAIRQILQRRRDRFSARTAVLEAISYKSVLARGYAVVRDAHDRPIGRAADVLRGVAIQIEFADGKVGATTGGSAPRRRKATGDEGQGSLL